MEWFTKEEIERDKNYIEQACFLLRTNKKYKVEVVDIIIWNWWLRASIKYPSGKVYLIDFRQEDFGDPKEFAGYKTLSKTSDWNKLPKEKQIILLIAYRLYKEGTDPRGKAND